jgi:hypothetical protein
MLLAGCGGSGGSAADAGAPIIRGAAPFEITNTQLTVPVGSSIVVTTTGGSAISGGMDQGFNTTGACTLGFMGGNPITATVPGECIVTAWSVIDNSGGKKERDMVTFTFTAAPALTADAPALTVSGTPTNPLVGETVTLTTAGGSGERRRVVHGVDLLSVYSRLHGD